MCGFTIEFLSFLFLNGENKFHKQLHKHPIDAGIMQFEEKKGQR